MKLKVQGTSVFERNWDALHNSDYKIICNQGGMRSSKTYSITQELIFTALREICEIDIVSQSLPHLKGGAMKDFKEIMHNLGIWNRNDWNATDNIYQFSNKSTIQFFSVDKDIKVRGHSRDYLFVNEANAINYDTWRALLGRTRKKIVFDFNPSDQFHWIYDHVKNRDDCLTIISTYKDNTFLPESQVREIEYNASIDSEWGRVYAKGLVGQSKATIYNNWSEIQDDFNVECYGLDFGFNHPMALVGINVLDPEILVKELIFESHMTVKDLIHRMDSIEIDKNKIIWADGARPEMIKEMQRSGYNVRAADKGKGSVKAGIDKTKSFKLCILNTSINLIKELKSYKWIEKGNTVTDEPLKINDDGMDAMRYAIYMSTNKPKPMIY